LESEHVGYWNVALDQSKEVWSLVGNGGHQNSSVTRPRNDKVSRISYLLLDEPLCSPDKVIKMILSLIFFAIIPPIKTFFTSTSYMSYHQNASEILEKC
jgi:hypothetical protein